MTGAIIFDLDAALVRVAFGVTSP